MNRGPLGLTTSQAVEGFIQEKMAEGLSPNTLRSYDHLLGVWPSRATELDLERVTTQDLRAFLAWLRTDYKPVRFSGSDRPLSPKSIRNT